MALRPRRVAIGFEIPHADAGGKAGKGFRLTRADGTLKLYFGVAFESESP